MVRVSFIITSSYNFKIRASYESKDLVPKNAFAPIVVTVFGISNDVNPVF